MELSVPLFGKFEGGNRVYIIGIKDSDIPYPEKDVRWAKYGAPLTSIFQPHFNICVLEWFPDDRGKLDQINVVCYGPKFNHKKGKESGVEARLVRIVDDDVKIFFEGFGARAQIIDLFIPTAKSAEDYVAQTFKQNGSAAGNEGCKPAIILGSDNKNREMIIALSMGFDASVMKREGATLHHSDDGRHFMGTISKADGNRYFVEVPEELAGKLS